jgi:squalene-hopene/tetraprenyl-beta-curcumene cyclase
MVARFVFAVLACNALILSSATHVIAATPPHAAEKVPDAPKYDPNEPLAQIFSLERSADYLDAIAAFWLRKSEAPKESHGRYQRHSCGACHANFAYMMARPLLLKEKSVSLLAETRRHMEQQMDTLAPGKYAGEHDSSGRYHFHGAAPTLAVGLVFHDLHTGGELRPTTRKALDKIWDARRSDRPSWGGPWRGAGCWDLSSPEHDGTYNANLAALAVGAAPDGYAREAKQEIAQLRQYLGESCSHLHAQTLSLWASSRLDGLLNATQREAVVRSLLATQCPDGGWSLANMGGKWSSRSDTKVGDGYATGLVVYALRQAGLPAERPEIARGITWLKKHQRASGGWFTSNADQSQTIGGIGTHDLAILNLGTAYAVMALHACENKAEIKQLRSEAKASVSETPLKAR